MADDTETNIFHYGTRSDDLPQVLTLALLTSSDVSATDIKSNIDSLFSELYTAASNGMVLQASREALDNVRSTWTFMKENTDELSRTCFSMQLVDRILHEASIYGPGQTPRNALAVLELVFNLNFAYSQDVPTPLNLRYLRRRMVCLLDELDTHMRARSIRTTRAHNFQPPALGHRAPDTITDCNSRYRNLCAFASGLARENIDVFEWEDIMTTAFNRARNNMSSRMPAHDTGDALDTRKAYLSGAEAWANYDIVQKSLQSQRISREAWRQWQDMLTEANSTTTDQGSRKPRKSLCKASKQIKRALEGVNDHDGSRRTRGSHTHRLFRTPART